MFEMKNKLQLGLIRPDYFQVKELGRRFAEELHLSKEKDVEPSFKAPILSMDVELSEGR
jgi:hypothetical protein